jgi:hypothetical protein
MQVNGLETLLFSLSLRERVGVRARVASARGLR